VAYFLTLFSPETYEAFTKSGRDVTGFRLRQQNAATRVEPKDKLVCYMTKLSRWVGLVFELRAGLTPVRNCLLPS
jgi:hypothetical protein